MFTVIIRSKKCVLYDTNMGVFICIETLFVHPFFRILRIVAGLGAENGCHIRIQGAKIHRLKEKTVQKKTPI